MRASHHTAINDRLEFSSGDSVKILSRKRITDVPAHMKPVEKAAPQYMQIEKLHIHDTHPFALVDCVVDLNAYRKFPKQADKKYKILKLLLETDGTSIAKGRQEITIAHACGRTASLLRCGVAAAVVKVRSWRHDQDGMLVFGSVTLYRGDRFIFDIVEENFLHNQASPLMIPKFRDPAA
jgi:GntR family transcriptional regulator